jgi:RNA polymerase sigma factor (sigma-70 family)
MKISDPRQYTRRKHALAKEETISMRAGQQSVVMWHLRRAGLLRDGGSLTDRQLLECFTGRHDQAAFAAIVDRHGPMVWGLCRRVLRNVHDAEDAFQATFLVLVRKAASLRSSGLLANWLYGVAYRTAMKARAATARRRQKEKQMIDLPEPRAQPADAWRDWLPLLDRELQRLPEKYQVAIVLCDLEGKTRKEAARLVGLPEGTLSTRLARARTMLARRLARHGLAVSGGTVAARLSEGAASAFPPAPLVSATVKAATLAITGRTVVAGVISAKVVALTEGVLKTMLLSKLKLPTVLVLAATVVGTGAFYYRGRAAAQDAAPQVPAAKSQDGGSERDRLRKENALLKQELRQVKDRAAALEARLAAFGAETQPVLYRGKPPSFWLKQLHDRDAAFRTEAVRVLGGIARDDRTMIPVLIEALQDRDSGIRMEAVCALREVGPPAQTAIPALLEAMNQDYSLTQGFYALQCIDPKARVTMPLLLEAMKDSTRRKRAVLILGQMTPTVLKKLVAEDKTVLPVLIEAVKEKNTDVRNLAANALLQLGPEARAAVPALIEALKLSKTVSVLELEDPALEALKKIDPEAAARSGGIR